MSEQYAPLTFAKATIQGRAGMDGVLRYTSTGKPVLSVSLAVNKGPKENRRTIWVTAKFFGDLAEQTQIKKGAIVTVEGNLDVSSWQDKTTLQERQRFEILANTATVHAGPAKQAPSEPSWPDDLPF